MFSARDPYCQSEAAPPSGPSHVLVQLVLYTYILTSVASMQVVFNSKCFGCHDCTAAWSYRARCHAGLQ
jgi:hypothetical protein